MAGRRPADPPPAGAHPTVRDVARRAGVSPMTVSRALSGGHHVADRTRHKVEKAADELGYVRNENARSLRPGQRSRLLGVVITNIENPYYAEVLLGVEAVAGRAGRRMLVGMSHGDPGLEKRLLSDFIARKVDGMVVVPSGGPSGHLQGAVSSGTPLVLASRSVTGLDVDTVLVDDVTGAREGTAALLARGIRRMAFLGNVTSVSTAQRRYEGYVLAHQFAGVDLVPELVVRENLNTATSRAAATAMLALDDPPDAIFAANNRIAVGALEALLPWRREHPDLAPPELVSFDDFDLSHLLDYPLTIIDHDPRELGRTAARMLIERLDATTDRPALLVAMPTRLR